MVTPTIGATTQIPFSRLGTDVEDPAKPGKALKFQLVKDSNPPKYEAKGKDGATYTADIGDVVVNITGSPAPDLKADRKAGRPIPKDKAKEIDEELKKEQEAKEKAEEEGQESPEVESMKKRSNAPEEAPTAGSKSKAR